MAVPKIAELGVMLRRKGYDIPKDIIRMEEMEDVLVRLFGKEARS